MIRQRDYTTFDDPVRAEKLLQELITPLIGTIGDGRDQVSPDLIADTFAGAILDSSNPDRALVNIHRLAEVSFGSTFIRDLFAQPVLLDTAVTLCSSSQYLADILVRNPAWFRWITASDVLLRSKSYEDFYTELKNQVNMFEKDTARYNSVRRFQRREMLRIGARDLLGEADLDETVRDLSNLAECISTVFFELVFEELVRKYRCTPEVPCAVIGLGKLGGKELNYSSDIDVMFVIGEDAAYPTKDGRTIHAVEFYYELADRWIRGLTEHTSEGKLYRVDARLRPDGDAGPLVRSVQGYLVYYETRGELWERQMLIKARPVAGNKKFGEEFVAKLAPFVYPVTLFESPMETIARLKQRIEKQTGEMLNVKLSRGGIRDIEFVVQALQLINGGKSDDIRTGSTLEGIRALERNGLLSSREASDLRTSYHFLRKTEHRLQMEFNTQIHTLPDRDSALNSLARVMRYESPELFSADLTRCVSAVRSVFDAVFGDIATDTPIETFFDGEIKKYASDLYRYGFKDVQKAAELLQNMALGISPIGVGDSDKKTRSLFRESIGSLLKSISETVSPDRAMKNLLLLLQTYPHPASLYNSFRNQALQGLILNVCAFSDRLVLSLSRRPGDTEYVLTQFPFILDNNIHEMSVHGRLKETIAHIKYINGTCSLTDLHFDLTNIARAKLEKVWRNICEDEGLPEPPLTVLTLGKFSGSELGPGGDIDVIFISDSNDAHDPADTEDLVQRFIKSCAEENSEENGYEIDARLRPEGQNAPLVVSLGSYRNYLDSRASLWERQSLIKARFMVGDERLAKEAERFIGEYVYRSPLPDRWVGEICDMRRKTETRSRVRRSAFIDVKFGPGGLMDIEFLVQMFQLHYGRREEDLRVPNTLSALRRLAESGHIDKSSADTLVEAYTRYRNVEYFNVMHLDTPSKLVPTGMDDQEVLQSFIKTEDSVISHFSGLQKEIRGIFDEETARLKTL
jgi:[glutamine synthetase] adenylyltransferase / [glutamine synthetase]-adenylyl-L-tyrosine phosphorylase